MKQFFNIGKTVLHRAIGLQENHTKINTEIIDTIDEIASGCNTCKHKILADMYEQNSLEYKNLKAMCETCPHKVIKQVIVESKSYINEKNRYGYQPRLKINAIKLLLVLNHLSETDGYGINIKINYLAEQLNCDKKTIKNNLEVLKKYNYILYNITETGNINFYLPEAENYYKKAKDGGRGYLTVSSECLKELLSIKAINSLRLALRGLMEFDELCPKGFTGYNKTYKEIKHGLPRYCKKGIINTAASQISLFTVEFDAKAIHFFIKEEFNAKKQKQVQLDYLEDYLNDFNTNFNLYISDYNNIASETYNIIKDIPCVKDFVVDANKPMHMVLHKDEIQDLAKLITQFSLEEVMMALSQVYNTYYSKGNRTDIKNLGAVIRKLININVEASLNSLL